MKYPGQNDIIGRKMIDDIGPWSVYRSQSRGNEMGQRKGGTPGNEKAWKLSVDQVRSILTQTERHGQSLWATPRVGRRQRCVVIHRLATNILYLVCPPCR